MFLFAMCFFLFIGCDKERTSDGYNTTDTYHSGNGDYPQYVSVEINAYTSWAIDIYIGDAYVGNLEPGRSAIFSKSLYGGEKLRLRFVVYNPSGANEVSLAFDDDYSNYHVNVYNDRVEHF